MTDQTAIAHDTSHRAKLRAFLELPRVTNTILAIIIFNAITLGMSTSDTVQASIGPLLKIIDKTVLAIFVIELLLKLYAYGWRFFRNSWNIFDLFVVVEFYIPRSCCCCFPSSLVLLLLLVVVFPDLVLLLLLMMMMIQ